MTVNELIDELRKYPGHVEVQMSMKVNVEMTIGKGKQTTVQQSVFTHGRVYGVSGSTGGKEEVVISGS